MSAGADSTVDRTLFLGEPAESEPVAAPDFEPPRRSLKFQPGLEGLRGLAVAAVLVFHGGFSWATGGFLGVSTFFTLSGYLITSLLLLEHSSTGTISLKRFWGRRFRRLMPASLVCLAGVVLLFAPFVASNAQLETLRGDVISALAYVANWHFVFTGQSYTNLFTAPSPVLHFWSLAIEEQFYVVFPLVMTLFVARLAMRRKALAWILAILAVLSTVEMAWLYNPTDTSRVYYGTDTRAAELLLGAVLAILMTERRRILSTVRNTGVLLGLVSLAAVIWLWHATDQSNPWLYRGGFAIYALMSCCIVFAATQRGVVRDLLSVSFLRWLGRISYGAYLLHWPIFLWLDTVLVGWNKYAAFVPKVAITFVLAEISMRIVELPIRERKLLPRWQPLVAAPAAIAIIVCATLITTSSIGIDRSQLAFASNAGGPGVEAFGTTSSTSAPDTGTPTTEPPVALPVNVFLFGDSLAETLANSYTTGGWGAEHPDVVVVSGAKAGCSVGVGGKVGAINVRRDTYSDCDDRLETWPVKLKDSHVDYVLMLSCLYDVADRQIPGDDQWRVPGDPVLDDWLKMSIRNTVASLTTTGAKVVWMTCPYVNPQYNPAWMPAPGPYTEVDKARTDRWNELIREVAADDPRMVTIELPAFLDKQWAGGQEDASMRPDGVHFTYDGAADVWDWLEPQLTSGDLLEPDSPT